eukprot:CAMPEP_0183790680 /NCGR_PEP_ID=MMETSP0803_2-20130417/1270_1 /TAXON_ID=195967 /ORGANISM="Crustomastix stigmata, Strain CCMP3273" /LENGTH=238 /DNA_ID=CAMNT_0026034933 /DNA_START=95 /DNA_END=811 /DNA_ORIENTATION=-
MAVARSSVARAVARRGCSARRSLRCQAVVASAEPEEPSKRVSPLEKGGTLTGEKAAGKDANPAFVAKMNGEAAMSMAEFSDPRWVKGTWDLAQFAGADGKTDWDAVIDAEVVRRKILEANPAPSDNDDPVTFVPSMIPWWAWVKRFHLPEAELANGRAAMVGYASAYLLDLSTHTGLVDAQSSFLGKTMIAATVLFVCLIRNTTDIAKFQGLLDEATFYDKQWAATWDGVERPSEREQ